tara:strand:+ start:96 stop:587 length:492 start_codon:yes stop_codon:yes gene_type:complete
LLINKKRKDYCNKTGKETEKFYESIVKSRGRKVIKSSKEDDMYKHIDYYVDGMSVDVKGNRHLDCIWLETKNVHGNKGWLHGEAEFIIFDIKELYSFCCFKRVDLLEFIKKNVFEYTSIKDEFLKFYSRKKWNRHDEVVKVKYNHIKHLQKGILNYKQYEIYS